MSTRHRLTGLALAALTLWSAPPAQAAVITCQDGRVLQGEILEEDDASLLLDTRVGSIRATLRLAREEVAEVDRSPLPADYFSEEPAGEARAEGAKPWTPGAERYLVVPIKGAFGSDVVEAGIQQVLSYAWRNRVGHLVFEVDSAGSDDLDEARAIFRLLGKYAERIQYHAWVKQATGDSLAILLQAHTIHLAPKARVGGALGEADRGEQAEEMASLRAVLAEGAAAVSRARGRPGTLMRAMIDPSLTLAVWLDEQGSPASGESVPEGVPAERVVLRCPAGELLTVSAEQVGKLGVPSYGGNAAGLGEVLGLTGWQAESDYAVKAMARAASQAQAAAEKSEKRASRDVERTLRRRDALVEALQHALAKAEQWDPGRGDYATYKRTYTWAWGQHGSWGQDAETNILTRDSRREWQVRTDTSLRYVNEALRAVRSLKGVEKRATGLGLEPLHSQDELGRLETDLKRKGAQLQAERDRKER